MTGFILLTGKQTVAKSAAIRQIVDLVGKENCGGFFIEEVRENGKRTGFKVVTLDGREAVLAELNLSSGKYKISPQVIDTLCVPILLQSSMIKKYIIIDEIGPILLQSENIKNTLLLLLNDNKQVIGTVYNDSYPWLDNLKKRENVMLLDINEGNKDTIPSVIQKMVK
ncbi:MAG: nucleoside-triphosphatase [Lactobacillaceae bacterium]|jgi:nucleoside-triphosphatase|nr:nucleoside-triphosphatase [Lactobacillaceae bacterium]